MGTTDPVILFDGVCNLCNSSIRFIIRHDKKSIFHFAALQSSYATRRLHELNISAGELNSIILVSDRTYQKSDAALEIVRHLSGAWPIFYIFKVIPRVFRDWLYDGIARNRYRIFGKKDQCMVPTSEVKARFIE